MTSDLLTVSFYALIGGVFSLAGGALLLRSKTGARQLAKYATPFAAGSLLAAVFLDLLQDGLEKSNPDTLMLATLCGVVGFFMLERFLRWFHHHHDHGTDEQAHTVGMIIIGDTLHNALDGVAIAASFLVSPATGIITTFAVAAHEIPQEIGDMGLLLARGMKRRNVLLVNSLSALATVLLAAITFLVGSETSLPTGWLIGVSAGFLLYIAMSDLIPTIHDSTPKKKLLDWRPVLLLVGVLVVGISIRLAHNYVDGDVHSASEATHSDSETESDHNH